jgi:serine/threonine protein kinase/tetratricopeptide (TPR) repeat protein
MGSMIGTILFQYRILQKLGEGGMGEVYLAQDTRLDRRVALKLLPDEYTQDDDRLRRFKQEAKAASGLNHPNIITIFDIGNADGLHYIATEYIEGDTLRDHIADNRLGLLQILDVAIQVVSALSAAHQAGIIHRDVKPENIMLRPDGYVKVLDFGLVKLAERTTGIEGDITTIKNTEPGIVMGTVRYMSPEQARSKAIDGRSDIFSLGITLYEVITGRLPFEGESTADLLAEILHAEPRPIADYVADAPRELQRILSKALRKETRDRYQTADEMLLDLENLRSEMQIRSKLGHSVGTSVIGRRFNRLSDTQLAEPDRTVAVHISEDLARTNSSDGITGGTRSYGGRVTLAASLAAVAILAYFYFNRSPVLTEQDTILVADFVNTTGDSIFDGTLKQGLAVQLGQSPYLNLFPDSRVRNTLRLMGRSGDERVTPEIGREICERQGLKALIVGSIAPLGSHYVITLEALNGRSGDVLAREQVESDSKERVLKTLSQAASGMREKLGESLGSIEKFDAPLEVTTSSLEALKAFSLGLEQTQNGKFLEAIPFYKRAIELDGQFAYAYGTLAINYYNTRQPKLAAEYAERAYGLRHRMSELEKLRITSFYFAFVTGEIDKGIRTVELYKRTYPRDERGPLNLSDRYGTIGQFENAVSEARQALLLNPNNAVAYWNLADSLSRLGRFSEAKEVCEQAIQQKLDTIALHYFLYQIGFVEGNDEAMQEQLSWSNGRLDSYMGLDWQNASTAFAGQWTRAQELSRRSIDLALRSNAEEVAGRYAAEGSLRAAAFGDCTRTRELATQALSLERNQVSLTRTTLALAFCGEVAQAQSLIDEMLRRYPKDTLINNLWLPIIRAAIELHRNDPTQAVQLLDSALRYEAVSEFWAQYVRGLAYLKLRSGNEAAAEFNKILSHRGEAPLSVLYSLARLGLARSVALTGDSQKSRDEYRALLDQWKYADPDLPILVEANREFKSVK